MTGAADPSAGPGGPGARLAAPGDGCEHGAVTTTPTITGTEPLFAPAPAPPRSAADVAVRRLLRISDAQPRMKEAELRSAFSRSILVSAVRCILTYLVIPFLLVPLGLASGVGPVIGVPFGVVAIVFNVKSIRRFWRADHKWRWAYTAIGTTVIAMLVVLVALDLGELVADVSDLLA